MAIEVCEDCGKAFEATKNQFLCPRCIKKRTSDNAKRIGLNQLGIEARRKKSGVTP